MCNADDSRATWCGLQVVTHARYSKAADVYSFGIVLWELMTWQVPWDEHNQFQVRLSLWAQSNCATHV